MHRNYVRSLERGERNVSLGNLLALARAFDVDLLELLEPVIRPGHL
jgi:transcriptional regulator with XRE-family HTH domain